MGFSTRFIPDISTIAEPWRRLTIKGTPFIWGEEQQASFNALKQRPATSATLVYFKPDAPTELIADASPVGLGGVLLQVQNGQCRPVASASRTLTPVEHRSSQTEREALGLVWVCERFHTYLLGTIFSLLTDHKPLEFIYSS